MDEPNIAKKGSVRVDLEPGTYWWCACGLSSTQPFCDGAHKETGFSPMKLEIDEEYTFGELAAHFPNEDQFLFDKNYVSNYQLMLLCDDNLKDSLGELLTPVYGNDWSIWVYEENNLIFACPLGILDGHTTSQSIPSTTPGTNLEVILEVEK